MGPSSGEWGCLAIRNPEAYLLVCVNNSTAATAGL